MPRVQQAPIGMVAITMMAPRVCPPISTALNPLRTDQGGFNSSSQQSPRMNCELSASDLPALASLINRNWNIMAEV
ncbi:hypothetical protein RRG08_040975 [Elysia crispata]|uniref:Uncharacterized protein n=1 Tax=Elysia crispata TaxID=231223 RepID=A0AAE0Z094_9GAST|nr:hypothetical protein RRG08_040975 [Elysia crispata]